MRAVRARRGVALREPPAFLNGAYAELLLVPERIAERNLLPVPPALAPEVAAMVEPLACCLHGVERAAVEAGQTVAILGPGPIGLMLCAASRDAGGRLGRRPPGAARALAASSAAEPGDGRGADVVIEAAGTAEAWRARSSSCALAAPSSSSAAARSRVTLPAALRGADAPRRVPPHAAPRPRRARLPRQRRLSVGAARDAPGRAGRWPRLRRSAARPAEGGRPAVRTRFGMTLRHKASF